MKKEKKKKFWFIDWYEKLKFIKNNFSFFLIIWLKYDNNKDKKRR